MRILHNYILSTVFVDSSTPSSPYEPKCLPWPAFKGGNPFCESESQFFITLLKGGCSPTLVFLVFRCTEIAL